MRHLRTLGIIVLIALTMALIGFLTYVTETVEVPGTPPTPSLADTTPTTATSFGPRTDEPAATESAAADSLPTRADDPLTGNDCDPSYPGVCIPPFSVVGDLNCNEITDRRFEVMQPDPHFFDPDFDGVGCEDISATRV